MLDLPLLLNSALYGVHYSVRESYLHLEKKHKVISCKLLLFHLLHPFDVVPTVDHKINSCAGADR